MFYGSRLSSEAGLQSRRVVRRVAVLLHLETPRFSEPNGGETRRKDISKKLVVQLSSIKNSNSSELPDAGCDIHPDAKGCVDPPRRAT